MGNVTKLICDNDFASVFKLWRTHGSSKSSSVNIFPETNKTQNSLPSPPVLKNNESMPNRFIYEIPMSRGGGGGGGYSRGLTAK